MHNPDLIAFEKRAGKTPTEAAVFFGVGYSSYSAWRAMRKPVPKFLRAHLRTLAALTPEAFAVMMQARLHG